MDLLEFKKAIKELVFRDGWKIYLDNKNHIRLSDPNVYRTCNYCPVTAMHKKLFNEDISVGDVNFVNRCFNPIRGLIIQAADTPMEYFEGEEECEEQIICLRRWFLKTFNLIENELKMGQS